MIVPKVPSSMIIGTIQQAQSEMDRLVVQFLHRGQYTCKETVRNVWKQVQWFLFIYLFVILPLLLK